MLVPLAVYGDPALKFRPTAVWLGAAMGALRGRPVVAVGEAPLAWLLAGKYLCAGFAAALVLAVAALTAAWWLWPAAVLAFYAVEVQWVFLLPVAMDGSRRPFRDSRALMQRAGGTWHALGVVLPIAFRMLTGRWGKGCWEVLAWYERVRDQRP